jgi:hypothetical protein
LDCIRTTDHKSIGQTGKGKFIHRFLPESVGELLVYYLWLVLPFWYTVKGAASGNLYRSTFVWSKDLVFREAGKKIGTNDLWDTNKLSSILNRMVKKMIGTDMNVSSWRHIAIAFSRRYLRHHFGDPSDDDNEEDDDMDDDEVAIENIDDVYDFQAAHSPGVAIRVYVPLVTHKSSMPIHIINAFRMISLEWHKFLFPSLLQSSDTNHPPTDAYREFTLRCRNNRLQTLAMCDLENRF